MKRYANPDQSFQKHINPRYLHRGVTLIELIISIVVLSIALLALISTMNASVGRSSNVLLEDRTVQLAQAYFDEILGKRFAEDTGVGGYPPAAICTINTEEGSRALYDDVDDYHGINEDPASQVASDFFSGSSAGYNIAIDVSCSNAATELGVSANKAKRITLTITDTDGRQRVFAAYKGNF